MTKSTIKWLGVTGFIIIVILCLLFKVEPIENDLKFRTLYALKLAGLSNLKIQVEGRDLTVTGMVNTLQQKENTGALLKSLTGVSDVNNELEIYIETILKKIPGALKEEDPKQMNITALSKNIFFQLDKALLNPASSATLDTIAILLNDNPELLLTIFGHTSEQGEENINIELSIMLADIVKNYLVGKEIESTRLFTYGLGTSKSVADNTAEEDNLVNRRVELKLSKEE